MRPSLAVVLAFLWAGIGGAQEPLSEVPKQARSKKGLQVQMVDDALALGIAHAALNVQLGHLLRPLTEGAPLRPEQGEAEVAPGWAVSAAALAGLDAQVRPLAEADVELNFILLARATHNPAIDALQFDPRYDPKAPNALGAFRVLDETGANYFRAVIEVLAQRYGANSQVGTVRGWIVGNEVNSHWWWYNLGEAGIDEVVAAYEPAVRAVHEVVSVHHADARIYLSLEHHWQARFAAGSAQQSCRGRAFVDAFAKRARAGGDFAWHLAYHPYPENLFDCRFWEDESALPREDSPRITFRNLEVLTTYLQREELLWQGKPRRVILSEQGFHCRDDDTGERDQAVAFALAWRKVQSLDGIDAFIYHRHVDHSGEGGLRFGLWRNKPGSIADPGQKRMIWELMRVCDTPMGGRVLGTFLMQAAIDDPIEGDE
jgi:hypothetical protein